MSRQAEGSITEAFLARMRARLRANRPVRRSLPGGGRIAIDRQLPFLCVHRRTRASAASSTWKLVTSEASYLVTGGERVSRDGTDRLTLAVVETMSEVFGGFIVLEVWAGARPEGTEPVSTASLTPAFRIFAPRANRDGAPTDELETALARLKLGGRAATVETIASSHARPKRSEPLLSPEDAARTGCLVYGLEVSPIYADPETGEVFPRVLRELRRKLSVAMRRFFFAFAQSSTSSKAAHFHALGRRAVVKAVWEVDRMLAEASESYDFLLQVTPINAEQAWNEFKRRGYERAPALHYRPLPAEPVVLKRALYRAPVERIEDPSLGLMFRQKLDELDRQITMLQDRNTDRFLHESIQLYGGVDDDLFALALRMLERIPPRSREADRDGYVDAETFAARAREEVDYLRAQHPDVTASVRVRDDIIGLQVSRGHLLVGARTRVPAARVDALLQHEVGTHVLTYFNGRAQTLRHLYIGLAGYDELQEGLAVLAEHLVGGLSRPRLRLLAGRVAAAHYLLEGATLVETFRRLTREHGFSRRTAFTVAVRIFRGGGLTKDAVYLRGLRQILAYLSTGGSIERLFVGKIAAQHIPVIRELEWRGVLVPPVLRPRYMSDPEALRRVEQLARGASVMDFVERTM